MAQLQSRYAALMQRAKEIAGMQPAQGIKLFVSEIPGAVQLHGYFYDNLQSDDWLPWLAKEGLLVEPLPDPLVSNVLRLWTWPVGRYLVRMAASQNTATRKTVGDAIRALRSSANPDVQRFGMDVVEALPAAEAADLADVVAGWLTPNNSPYTSAPHKVIAALAGAGLIEPAMQVTKALFQVFAREGRLAALFDATMYEFYLNEAVKHLAKAASLEAIPVLCDLLRQASYIDKRFTGLGAEDYTYYSVGPLATDQAPGQDIHGALILSIVRLARAAIQVEPSRVLKVHEILQAYKGRIFLRIQLYIVSLAPSETPSLAEGYLTDVNLLDAGWCRMEYAELAKAWFPSLSSAKQKAILDAVDAIPDEFFDRWKDRYQKQLGRSVTTAEEREYRALTIRDLLWEWRGALPAERREELDAYVKEFGDPHSRQARFFAEAESPLSRESMQAQSIEDTIAYLDSWKPEPGLQTHTISALSNELRESAAADPILFSANAQKFGRLKPVFIRRMLEGLRQPTANGATVDWTQLLALTKIVLEKSDVPVDTSGDLLGDDPDWSLTLGVIIDVLAGGLRRDIGGIESIHEEAVKFLVLSLHKSIARLPKPDTDRFNIHHPYFSAQQTIYGATIELCILLLLWISRNPTSAIAQKPREILARAPEVRNIFEAAIADQSSLGRISRAIFGHYLDWLFYFGEEWTHRMMARLFPAESKDLREAAWISHLQSVSGPFGPLLNELDHCYTDHIANLGNGASSDRDASDNRLSEYLMVRYLWDLLPEDLLQQFWQAAPVSIRRHAMWFMGRQIAGTDEKHKERAISYWDRRLKSAMTAHDPEPYRKELGTIGQWFLWEVDHAWLMDQLLLMLNAGFSPNDGLGVIDKLAEHIPEKIDQVIDISKAFVRRPEMDSWILVSQAESLRKILIEGKKNESSTIRAGVQEIIGYLASRGNTSFLDLAEDK